MRIEIIKSKETSLVIDDIGKAIEEGDILKEGYLKAIHALQRYLDQSRLIRDELKNARERGTDSQSNDILYRSPQNIIAFSGKRGTGKDYCSHPVFRFNDRKLTAWKSTARPEARDNTIQLNVCINTDDLGVFDTNLEFEYALLYEALRKRMEQNNVPADELKENFVGSMGENKENYQYSSHDILDYLDDLRVMGNRAVFPTYRSSK